MTRQYSNPYITSGGTNVIQLQPAKHPFSEDWLQEFVFAHYHSIPINEIEPAFSSLIPVCRELPTKAGPIDLLFINSAGLLTLVECKLWKNPEARRQVVGQILDYAKEMSQWSYEQLQRAVTVAQGAGQPSIFELVKLNAEDSDERDFVDSVTRNLRRGRFLLVILGDGIRENVEQIAEFLEKYAHLNFSLALVEYGVFSLPGQPSNEYVIQPRLVARTVDIVRGIFKIEDNQIVLKTPVAGTEAPTPSHTTLSEQVFFERFQADSVTKAGLETLLGKLQSIGISGEPGHNANSLKLKSNLYGTNFGVFQINGSFYNCAIASSTEEMGQPQIGEEYLQQLANLLKNSFVKQTPSRMWWTVMTKDHKGDRYVTAAEVLTVQSEWFNLIRQTLDRIASLETTP